MQYQITTKVLKIQKKQNEAEQRQQQHKRVEASKNTGTLKRLRAGRDVNKVDLCYDEKGNIKFHNKRSTKNMALLKSNSDYIHPFKKYVTLTIIVKESKKAL